MQISTFALYGMIEAILLLLLICVCLLIYVRRNKSKILGLQQTVQKLLTTHKQLQQKTITEQGSLSTTDRYKKLIDDQLITTKNYHKTLEAGQDIALDLNPNCPKDRRTAAIRHALLVAEKEALNNSDDGSPNWEFLQSKYQQLIQFYVDLSPKINSSKTDSVEETK